MTEWDLPSFPYVFGFGFHLCMLSKSHGKLFKFWIYDVFEFAKIIIISLIRKTFKKAGQLSKVQKCLGETDYFQEEVKALLISKLTVLGRKELLKGNQTSGRVLLCLSE